MNTRKLILAAAAVAIMASPAMAQSQSGPAAAGISNAQGVVILARTDRSQAKQAVGEEKKVRDCEHIAFPQCGDSPLPGEDR